MKTCPHAFNGGAYKCDCPASQCARERRDFTGEPARRVTGSPRCEVSAAEAERAIPTRAPAASLTSTLSERGTRYGEFKDQAVIAEGLVAVMLKSSRPAFTSGQRGSGWCELAPDQREALRVIANKIGRILNGDPNYSDSWHDIAGYATLVDNRLKAGGK